MICVPVFDALSEGEKGLKNHLIVLFTFVFLYLNFSPKNCNYADGK